MTPHSVGALVLAWSPYLLLVVFVLLWGDADIKLKINHLHAQPSAGLGADDSEAVFWNAPHGPRPAQRHHAGAAGHQTGGAVCGAVNEMNWLSASGTACFLAAVATALVLRITPRQFLKMYVATFKQLN